METVLRGDHVWRRQTGSCGNGTRDGETWMGSIRLEEVEAMGLSDWLDDVGGEERKMRR